MCAVRAVKFVQELLFERFKAEWALGPETPHVTTGGDVECLLLGFFKHVRGEHDGCEHSAS